MIVPIYKKGDKDTMINYRGITLLNTAYKLYAMCLEERLKAELEEKGIIPETQAGFRSGRSTIDNIFILNYIANTELVNKGGKVYAFFADLSAAFDKVNREKLGKIMEINGISKNLKERINEIYKETKNIVRVNGAKSDSFRTTKEVRQGCLLSPTLYNIYTADMEKNTTKSTSRRSGHRKRKNLVTGIRRRHCIASKINRGT